MLLKLVWILILFGRKYHQENAKNGIYERLDFKINPPKSSCLRRFAIASVIRKVWLRPCPRLQKTISALNVLRCRRLNNNISYNYDFIQMLLSLYYFSQFNILRHFMGY